MQVASYARRFQFSPQQDAEMRARLSQITRLLREYHCPDTHVLLERSEKAAADLEHWHNSQGAPPPLPLGRLGHQHDSPLT